MIRWAVDLLRVELRSDVRCVADHTGAERPLDGQPPDDERRNEDARDNDGGVDGAERYGAETVFGVDRRLQIGGAL